MEDDPDLRQQLEKLLETETYTVDTAEDGLTAVAMLQQYQYDLIVMDWNLPEKNGPEVIKDFRQNGGATPVIMLTGEEDIARKEEGFDAGADDYLTKPFNARELSARLRALLRRTPSHPTNTLTLGDLKLNIEAYTAELAGEQLKLQRLEFALLEFLMRNVGKVFSVEALLERVWPADSEASIETVRGYIKTLKKKMAAAAERPAIRNLHGLGYKLDLLE